MKTKTASFGTTSRFGHDSTAFYKRKLYDKSHHSGNGVLAFENRPKRVNVIYKHDSRNMKHLFDDSVHLMITSPPYNVGKDYDDDLSLSEYLNLLDDVMRETYRVLVDGGRACINIANIGRKPYIPLNTYIAGLMLDCGFLMRGEIIWDKGASAGVSCAWGSWQSASNPCLRDVHEYILVFSKGSFSRQATGKSNTIERDDFIENTKSIWRMPTASAKKEKHPAPFPVELPTRLIHLYSYENDIILDPFMGGGSTAVAAVNTKRCYIGYEIEKKYIDVAKSKLGLFSGEKKPRAKHRK